MIRKSFASGVALVAVQAFTGWAGSGGSDDSGEPATEDGSPGGKAD